LQEALDDQLTFDITDLIQEFAAKDAVPCEMWANSHSSMHYVALENVEVVRIAYSWAEKKDLIVDRYISNMDTYDSWCPFFDKYQNEEYMAVVRFHKHMTLSERGLLHVVYLRNLFRSHKQ